MTDIDNLIERLRDAPPHQTLCQVARQLQERCAEAANALTDERLARLELAEILRQVTADLDAYRKATGGLTPEEALRILPNIITADDIAALRAATFKEPT